jgi:hypothetical protein
MSPISCFDSPKGTRNIFMGVEVIINWEKKGIETKTSKTINKSRDLVRPFIFFLSLSKEIFLQEINPLVT